MIKTIHIENYALIRSLDINFATGFTSITGETGSGKSILLGAIGLLAGNRADHSVLLNEDQKCIIEGIFELEKENYTDFFKENDIDFDGEAIIRREISSGGKSRSFLNDTPVQLNLLKDLGNKIINIHSQHETLLIAENHFQIQTLDSYCNNNELLADYINNFKQYTICKNNIEKLTESLQKQAADRDYYTFLFNELQDSQISEEEEKELLKKQTLLQNAEKIEEGIYNSLQILSESENNVLYALKKVFANIQNSAKYMPELESICEQASQAIIDLTDISDSLHKLNNKTEINPKLLDETNKKLDEYNRLLHKHKVIDVAQLIKLKSEFEQQLEYNNNLELKIETEKHILSNLELTIEKLSAELSKKRKEAATSFAETIINTLNDLGMPNAAFSVEFEKSSTFKNDGTDNIKFLFTANKGEKLQDIGSVVSGGEMSRLMLSIKSMTAKRNMLPTIIFDEIDSGVSGIIAAKMGNILKKISANHQVLAITHLPQIAARGEEHIHVVKEDIGEKMQTQLIKLSNNERIKIIAGMISDENITESALEMARELLTS